MGLFGRIGNFLDRVVATVITRPAKTVQTKATGFLSKPVQKAVSFFKPPKSVPVPKPVPVPAPAMIPEPDDYILLHVSSVLPDAVFVEDIFSTGVADMTIKEMIEYLKNWKPKMKAKPYFALQIFVGGKEGLRAHQRILEIAAKEEPVISEMVPLKNKREILQNLTLIVMEGGESLGDWKAAVKRSAQASGSKSYQKMVKEIL